MTGENLFRPHCDRPNVSVLDTAVLVSAMVVALLSGLYAGLGIRAEAELDRRAEMWFAVFMWATALSGLYLGGKLGIGMVNGTQVLLIAWSVLHFPNIRTLETPMPRLFPASTLVISVVSVVILALAAVIVGLP
jgi:hypothetical protein